MSERVKKLLLTAGSIVFWIIFWQLGATLSNRKLLLKIPLPLDTVSAFCENCTKSEFWAVVAQSLLNIILGFLAAAVIGITGAMAAGHSKLFKSLSSPVLHMVRAVPVAAFIIVAWLWIPAKILPSFIAFLMVLPIIWSHVDAGLSSIDNGIVEMAGVYKMSRLEIITKIKLPFILPQLRTGCITGLGIAWKAGVAAEIITSPSNTLGALLSHAKTSIDYEQVFAITLTIIILSILMESLLKFVWKEQKR